MLIYYSTTYSNKKHREYNFKTPVQPYDGYDEQNDFDVIEQNGLWYDGPLEVHQPHNSRGNSLHSSFDGLF